MRVDLPVESLTEGEVQFLIDMFRGQEQGERHPGWRRTFAALCEALRAESARCRMEAAKHRDPLGHFWFGRL